MAATATQRARRFIESWLGKLKERLVWRTQLETLDQARRELASYINDYHHRPHSGRDCQTPAEVAATGEMDKRD